MDFALKGVGVASTTSGTLHSAISLTSLQNPKSFWDSVGLVGFRRFRAFL